MNKTFEVELIKLTRDGEDRAVVQIKYENAGVWFSISNGLLSHMTTLLPSEAVTIGEQLIAAGKAGEA
ncbi:hypothetical protein CEE55_22365 [Stenotrophomonas pavanii]|uniref:Uncharacterized protein n=1 Tax=Stenotrophomonas pavanii TaxID=487698 RepID=A0A246KQH4_9GAMM|nr:hypothetical protein [Stenotrophomonas pavanii]OWR25630.1 hypothetical protein CEE55_22365 [Stenotrophomonas pavanii]